MISAVVNGRGEGGIYPSHSQPQAPTIHNCLETAKNSQKKSVDACGPAWQGGLVMTEGENQFSLTRAASSK